MRLWTIHPKHLDAKGIVALWREGLLAQKVLQGRTRGYKHHPQLIRFAATSRPVAAIAAYLVVVCNEATRRGYSFDRTKIARTRYHGRIKETRGQLRYEWRHLLRKLKVRAPARFRIAARIKTPDHHPLFRVTGGPVQKWEIMRTTRSRKTHSSTASR